MSLVHAELTSASAWQLFKLLSAHSSIFTVGDVLRTIKTDDSAVSNG